MVSRGLLIPLFLGLVLVSEPADPYLLTQVGEKGLLPGSPQGGRAARTPWRGVRPAGAPAWVGAGAERGGGHARSVSIRKVFLGACREWDVVLSREEKKGRDEFSFITGPSERQGHPAHHPRLHGIEGRASLLGQRLMYFYVTLIVI